MASDNSYSKSKLNKSQTQQKTDVQMKVMVDVNHFDEGKHCSLSWLC